MFIEAITTDVFTNDKGERFNLGVLSFFGGLSYCNFLFKDKGQFEKGEYYYLEPYYSPKHKSNVFRILQYNNKAFNDRYFEIHVGNTEKDTEGCLLVGQNNDDATDTLYMSRLTFRRLYDFLSKERSNNECLTLKFV